MAEWLKAHAWKACLLERVTWVRIPLSPPSFQWFTAPQSVPAISWRTQSQSSHFRLCTLHFIRHDIPVGVECGLDISVAHHLLLHRNGRADRIHPRPEAVTHRVSSQLANARPCSCLLERFPHIRVRNGQSSKLHRTRKHPILIRRELGGLLPVLQQGDGLSTDGHRPLGIFRLDLTNSLSDDASFHTDPAVQPIDIRPLKG